MTHPRSRPLRLGRIARTQVRRDWPMSVAIGLGMVAIVALSSAVVLVQTITAEAGLQDTLRGLGPLGYVRIDERGVKNAQAFETFDETMPELVGNVLGSLVRVRAIRVETDPVQSIPGPGTSQAAGLARLGFMPDLERHSRLVQGQAPSQDRTDEAWNVTASEPAVRSLQLQVGHRYCFATLSDPPSDAFCARLSGVWRALNDEDAYWGGQPVPDSVLTVSSAAYFEVLRALARTPQVAATATVLFEPDLARFHQANWGDVLARFRQLRARVALRTTADVVTTGLDGAIPAFEARLQLARFTIELIGAQLVLVALFSVAFLSGHALAQRRRAFAIWRSRGWSWHAIWRLLLLESVLIAVPALPLGLGLGWLASVGLTRLVSGGRTSWAPPVAAGDLGPAIALAAGAALLVLALQALVASRHDLLTLRRQASRPLLRGWWQWRYLDVGLAVVSVPMLAATRLLGQSEVRAHGAEGNDPISLVLPGLALFLLGTALLRLLPLIGAVSGLVRRSTAWSLATLHLTRSPVEHAGLALLLVVATAVGVFAGVYMSTAPRNSADRAAYAAGADIRAHFDGAQPPVAAAVAGLQGVKAASYVVRTGGTTEVGSPFQPTVLGVDPYSLQSVIWSRPDLASRPIPELVQELADRERGGLLLPGRPRRIGIWAYGGGTTAQLRVDLSDGAGRPGQAVLGTTDFPGWRYIEAPISLPGGPVRYPLRFRDLIVQPTRGDGGVGSLGLADLGVAGAGDAQPTVVEQFAPANKDGTVDW